MANLSSLFALIVFTFVITQHASFASVLRTKLKSLSSSQEIETSHTNKRGVHHRHSREAKRILRLLESEGFTVLLLRHRGRGRRHVEAKHLIIQRNTEKNKLGSAILERISSTDSTEEWKSYENCYWSHLRKTNKIQEAQEKCQELKPN